MCAMHSHTQLLLLCDWEKQVVAHFPGSIVVISRLKLQCSVGIFTFYINNLPVPARLAVINLGVIIIFIILIRVVTEHTLA